MPKRKKPRGPGRPVEAPAGSKLGRRIRSLRLARGLTGQQLAEQAGLPQQTVNRLEIGRAPPYVPRLVALARALGVSLDELLNP